MKQTIQLVGNHPPVAFAGRELTRYLRLATGKTIQLNRVGIGQDRHATFMIGTCDDLGISRPRHVGELDDWIHINPYGRGYLLTGSNPRSVLFAVYRYLRECGFKWIRPGRRGQIIPTLASGIKRGLKISERASYRYRTICIEGSCSRQHVIDLVDWMAKHAMNGYFIQFHYGTFFFRRWYHHEGNEYLKPQKFDVVPIVESVIKEVTKRGMRLERMGHGWTCMPLGLPSESWDQYNRPLPASKQKWLAKVDGNRKLWRDVPLNTNLCYSNPQVRLAVIDCIARYAKDNPHVDAIHFWLADWFNNNCECRRCRQARPADYFVQMLNELDEKLTVDRSETRIIFVIYVDLLWPPLRQRIRNTRRFILEFAPISRSYLTSFVDSSTASVPMRPFKRNRLRFPEDPAENVAYLRAWQRQYDGDGFDFDYHLIWACYLDWNQFTLATTLHRDLRGLKTIGLDGFNSCQVQRQFFPHSLLMDVLATTLWNRQTSLNTIVDQSFSDSFGRDSKKVSIFFRDMSKLHKPFFNPVYSTGLIFVPTSYHVPSIRLIAQSLRNIGKMQKKVEQFTPLVARNLDRTTGATRWSWRYLKKYLDLLKLLLPTYTSYLLRTPDTTKKFNKTIDFLKRNEMMLHPVLDVNMATAVLQRRAIEVEQLAEHV